MKVDREHLYQALRYGRKNMHQLTEDTPTEVYCRVHETDTDFVADLIEKEWQRAHDRIEDL